MTYNFFYRFYDTAVILNTYQVVTSGKITREDRNKAWHELQKAAREKKTRPFYRAVNKHGLMYAGIWWSLSLKWINVNRNIIFPPNTLCFLHQQEALMNQFGDHILCGIGGLAIMRWKDYKTHLANFQDLSPDFCPSGGRKVKRMWRSTMNWWCRQFEKITPYDICKYWV